MINNLDFLVCPECKSQLHKSTGTELQCVKCSNKYEIKSVNVSTDNHAYNFKLGGTFSISDIMSDIQKLNETVNGKKKSEVTIGDINKIKSKAPKEWKAIEQRYRDVTYKNYFSKESIMFIYNTGPNLGTIASIKKVKKNEIFLERVTSGTIKPRVKL